MTPLVASVCMFLLVYGAAASLYAAIYGSQRTIQDRFADLAEEVRTGDAPHEPGDGLIQRFMKWSRKHLPKPNLESRRAEMLNRSLLQAGFLRSTALHSIYIVTAICVLATGLLGVLFAMVLSASHANSILLVGASALLGFMLPTYWIKRRARLRQQKISDELPDALDLLIVCIEAGLGLNEAIKVVGTETESQEEEIGRELALVSSEMSSGASLGAALRGMAERTAAEDIGPLAATLIQNEQLGARIGPALRASADVLRSRRKLRAEEAVQKLTIKILFPLAVFVLPAMMMLILGPALIKILAAFS
jgi:tight adherence protein C